MHHHSSVARIAILDADVRADTVRARTDSDVRPVLVAADFDAGTCSAGTGADVRTGLMLVAADVSTGADSARSRARIHASLMLVSADVRSRADSARSGFDACTCAVLFTLHMDTGAGLLRVHGGTRERDDRKGGDRSDAEWKHR